MELYGIKIFLKSTAPLTFRHFPYSTIHIKTYPFIPPTTFSGWLERIRRLSKGQDIPFECTIPLKNDESLEWIMEDRTRLPGHIMLEWEKFCCLGAYPENPSSVVINIFNRQGPKNFEHNNFGSLCTAVPQDESKIKQLAPKFEAIAGISLEEAANRYNSKKGAYQLLRWEFLMPIDFYGLVVAKSKDILTELLAIQGWGLNIGKEGYVFVQQVSEIFPLRVEEIEAHPSTLVPIEDATFASQAQYFPVYYFKPSNNNQTSGYYSELFALIPDKLSSTYWTNREEQIFIPNSMVYPGKYFCWW